MLEEGAGPGFWRRVADTAGLPGFPPRCRQGCPGELARLQGERAVELASHTGEPAWWREDRAAGRGLVPPPPEPLLSHVFEIYGKIFGLSQWAGGHRWVAWESSEEKPGL